MPLFDYVVGRSGIRPNSHPHDLRTAREGALATAEGLKTEDDVLGTAELVRNVELHDELALSVWLPVCCGHGPVPPPNSLTQVSSSLR